MKSNTAGLYFENLAQQYFLQDPDLLVFVPLGGLGPIDVVTLNTKTGEYQGYDIKAGNFLKTEKISKDKNGWLVRRKAGAKIRRGRSPLQKKLKIKIIHGYVGN